MSDLMKFCGLWKSTDKNGNETFSGTLNYNTRLVVFTNTFKEKDSDPDYIVYLAPNKKREDSV